MRHPDRLVWLLALVTWPAAACLWDRDTLAAERAGLPAVYDAILGLYPRHTKEFYQHRIETIVAAHGERPETPELYDDLAVARERLADYPAAIALMREKEQRWPGQYTTWANLGTFLAHSGDLAGAEEAIARALEINSEAHFGRERYQLLAIQFARRVQADPEVAERECLLGYDVGARLGETFRIEAPCCFGESDQKLWDTRLYQRLGIGPDVFDGIVGMMVIAQTDWPEFQFTLGELLAARGDRRLAWHAYQRAYDLRHPRSADLRYYQDQVLRGLEPAVQRGLTEASHWRLRRRALGWVEAYQRFERRLLAGGGDPEDPASYEPFFREHPKP